MVRLVESHNELVATQVKGAEAANVERRRSKKCTVLDSDVGLGVNVDVDVLSSYY